MTDEEIIALDNARNENALLETKAKFESLCKAISVSIVGDKNDSEEILNDTYKVLWDTIPPKHPDSLKAYICRVAKNLSLKRYEYNSAKNAKANTMFLWRSLGTLRAAVGLTMRKTASLSI